MRYRKGGKAGYTVIIMFWVNQISLWVSVLFLLSGCGVMDPDPTPTNAPSPSATVAWTSTSAPSPSASVVPTLTSTIDVTPPAFLYETGGPFIFPSWGYFGVDFKERYDMPVKVHPGIDIFPIVKTEAGWVDPNGLRNPVFAVYDGWLGRSITNGYINVCHTIVVDDFPDLQLDFFNVCTYYAHLELSERFSDLSWGCTDKETMIEVRQGEYIGIMDDADPYIHLHFSVKIWDIDGDPCWYGEASAEEEDDLNWEYMLDPLPYFGLESGFYSWMNHFPKNQKLE